MLKQAVQTLNTLAVTIIEVFLLRFMALNISNASLEIPDHTVTEEVIGFTYSLYFNFPRILCSPMFYVVAILQITTNFPAWIHSNIAIIVNL
jgi:hypothetical protein